jgi:hypothetical protein
MHTVAELKDGVSGLLTGTNLKNVTNLYGAFQRASRTLAQHADIPEATKRLAITLYDHVFDYSPSGLSDIFGQAVVDLRPQGASRSTLDEPYRKQVVDFDQTKLTLPNGAQLTFEYQNGTPIIRIASSRSNARAVLDSMTDTTGWTIAGAGSSLVADQNVYYEAPASLRFTCTGASTTTLTKAIAGGNLSDYQRVGVIFLAIYTPSGTDLSSISVKIGSSASAYTSVSATQGFLGAWTAGEWTLVALDLASGADTGSPDYTAIDYLQISIAHAGTLTNMRVGGMWISMPNPSYLIYQTNAIFLSNGSLSSTITNDNDSIILNDAAYNIYEYECANAVAEQMSGGKKTTQIQGFDIKLHGGPKTTGLYDLYRADNPSQELRAIGAYYG